MRVAFLGRPKVQINEGGLYNNPHTDQNNLLCSNSLVGCTQINIVAETINYKGGP